MQPPAKVKVPCFGKLNLDLRVLGKRPDGYHEVRTIYQTITLKDTLAIEFSFAKRTQIEIQASEKIEDNLVVRTAKTVLEHLKTTGWVRFSLHKRIPIGAGLGGGSSDAAAVLIALPALAGKQISFAERIRLAESLGSDVAFFLHGGTAVGMGRGTELYPLPDQPPRPVLVVSPGFHVSTAEAYRALNRPATSALTSGSESPMLGEFQTVAWALANSSLDQLPLKNDFEEAVFGVHQGLAALARKLRRLGANPAHMTGSGSALFGVFRTIGQAQAAASHFSSGNAFAARFLSRGRYQSIWRRSLNAAARNCFPN